MEEFFLPKVSDVVAAARTLAAYSVSDNPEHHADRYHHAATRGEHRRRDYYHVADCSGGRVEKDQSLLEVETDKVALEIPSPSSGFLTEVLIPADRRCPAGNAPRAPNTEAPDTGVVSRVGE